MKLIVDAMGGDRAPEEIILGAVMGRDANPGVEIIFTGDGERIAAVLNAHGIDRSGIGIEHAPTAIAMEEDPLCILKTKKDSSMAKGLCLLRDGAGDAFLSAGSTGALIMGASSRIYRIKLPGIRR